MQHDKYCFTDKHIKKYKYIKVTHYTSQIYRYKIHTHTHTNKRIPLNKQNQKESCKLTSSLNGWYNFSASPIKYSPVLWQYTEAGAFPTTSIVTMCITSLTSTFPANTHNSDARHSMACPSYSSPFVHPLTISGLQSSAFEAHFRPTI